MLTGHLLGWWLAEEGTNYLELPKRTAYRSGALSWLEVEKTGVGPVADHSYTEEG